MSRNENGESRMVEEKERFDGDWRGSRNKVRIIEAIERRCRAIDEGVGPRNEFHPCSSSGAGRKRAPSRYRTRMHGHMVAVKRRSGLLGE